MTTFVVDDYIDPMTSFIAADVPSMRDRTIVITGANSGVGRATATALAEKGARVVLAVRNLEKGRVTAESIAGHTEVRHLDLADLSSVREFAEGFTDSIDVLINNAGISIPPLDYTVDGFESQFGTNHLGHFALTNLLLPQVRDRVVTVGSLAHLIGEIDFTDLNWRTRKYKPYTAYAQSKLANHVSAHELQRRLAAHGSPIRSIVAHPGIATTNLMNADGPGLRYRLEKLFIQSFAQSAAAGALPSLYAATADIPGDSYVGPSDLMGARGTPALVKRARRTRNVENAQRLWEESEQLTGTTFPMSALQFDNGPGR